MAVWTRVGNYYKRNVAAALHRKPLAINADRPLISFTFDDFPRSALLAGGAILQQRGLCGTYYASLGLMGRSEPSGRIFVESDLATLVEQGHELGCHTFSHCHSWNTAPRVFEESIRGNRSALRMLLPEVAFASFSYPISSPRPATKGRVAPYFSSCRGGGQTFNAGTADLNQLAAYFLEKSRDRFDAIAEIVEANRRACGWLIFATHDIDERPTPYGCTPHFFETVVECAVRSGARVLPVTAAVDLLRAGVSSARAALHPADNMNTRNAS